MKLRGMTLFRRFFAHDSEKYELTIKIQGSEKEMQILKDVMLNKLQEEP
ncbi:MAG: hypothetical protein MUP17_09520 [candidate division Zixibacteria bacterium]|nr:hypothetical protein [candidate division Zixibacteria bacterium]